MASAVALEKNKPAVTPHPVRRVAYFAYAGGTALLGLGALSTAAGGFTFWFFPLGAFFLAYGVWVQNVGQGAQVLNKALNLAATGKLGEAEALLDWGEKAIRRGRLDRALAIQRTLIAMRRGDVDKALVHADLAVSRPVSWLLRRQDQVQRVAALGVRAVLRASRGDAAGARADAALVRASSDALPESLARAALAEAIVAERAGDFAALRACLDRDRQIMSSSLRPRERALVRAYQRMLKAPSTTVYRSPPVKQRVAETDEPELADWIAKIAPAAAAFAPSPSRARADAIAAPAADADAIVRARARKPARGAKRSQRGLLIFLWLSLIAIFTALWQVMTPKTLGEYRGAPIQEPVPASQIGAASVGIAIFALVLLGVVWARVSAVRTATRQLFRALNAVARGDASAAADLLRLTKSAAPLAAAQAHHQLAALADRSGNFADELSHAEAGLGLLASPAMKMASSDFVYPNLLSERAFALLALGRREESLAELAIVAEQFPSFPFLARATFRVSLLDAIQCGDYARAGDVAGAAVELPVTPREELLADVARAVASPETVGAGELGRIREELRTEASAATWVRALAAPLLETFWRGDGERGEPSAMPEHDREVEAEREAAAEVEALAELKAASQAR